MGNYQTTEQIEQPPSPPNTMNSPRTFHLVSGTRAGTRYHQVAPSLCQSVGIQDVLADPSKHTFVNLSDGSVIAIIGSGYHIVAAFSGENGGKPRGVIPAGGRPDTTVTLDQTIEDIRNATSVKIRKNPLDAEKSEIKNALDNLEADDTDATSRQKLLDQANDLEKRFEQQLEEEKQKAINWLNTYSDDPTQISACFVREVKRKATETPAKPSWVSGLIKSMHDNGVYVDYVIDVGSGKISVVDETGCCTLNEKYDDNWTIEEYITRVKEAYPDKNIIARLTGKWRSLENEREKQEIIAALEKADIPTETLAHQKEAEYAALHTLDIVAPYYRDAKHIFTEELGGGSFQATLFEQRTTEQARQQ